MPLVMALVSYYWKPMLLGAVLVAAFAYRAVLIHQRDDARERIVALNDQMGALRTSNQALGQMIDRQNAAVAELKARADASINTMAASEAAGMREGAAAQNEAKQKADKLIETPIAADSGCLGAIRWGNSEAAELSSW